MQIMSEIRNAGPAWSLLAIFGLVIGFALSLAALPAQDFAIARSAVGNGGGISSGGDFTLAGTIGQPAVGRPAGGDFQLGGGFWNEVSLPLPGGATLALRRVGNQIIISWPAGA